MSMFLKRIMADESGASTAEYAILLGAVAAASFAAVALFGSGLNALFSAVNAKLLDYVAT